MPTAKWNPTDPPSTSDAAADKAGDVAKTVEDKASEVASEAKDHAQQLLLESRQNMRAEAEAQGAKLSSIAKELAKDLSSMASASQGQIGGLVEQGADQISNLANRFDTDGLEGFTTDVRRVARRRPLVFVASTFAAGFAAGRMLRNIDNEELKSAIAQPDGMPAASRDQAAWTGTLQR